MRAWEASYTFLTSLGMIPSSLQAWGGGSLSHSVTKVRQPREGCDTSSDARAGIIQLLGAPQLGVSSKRAVVCVLLWYECNFWVH